jgi:hypothetical protein
MYEKDANFLRDCCCQGMIVLIGEAWMQTVRRQSASLAG